MPVQPADTYERFSEIYDLLGFHRFSRRCLEKTEEFLAHTGLCVTRLLDLACGTGHYAAALARRGVEVVGVDQSAGMLKCAERNARSLRKPPEWRQASLTRFAAPGRFELITCWFDSLNHLSTDLELLACFRRARKHLAPGGALLFDVNTPAAFRERWTMSQYRSTSGYVVHEHGLADPSGAFGLLELEAFVKKGRAWERYRLPFVQRGLTPEILEPLLTKARFHDIHFESFEAGEQLAGASRILVSART